MKLEREFRTVLTIEFLDPETSEKYFIDGNWSESFWACDDLEELGESLLEAFASAPYEFLVDSHDRWRGWGKDVEGFVKLYK